MSETSQSNRPLSPHLGIYRMYVTMLVSGLHRITGLGMTISAFLVVWWFVALAVSPSYFAFVDGILSSWLGKLVLIASLLGLSLHMLNGIRHLIWDTGSFLGKKSANRGAWIVLIGSVVLTVVALFFMALG